MKCVSCGIELGSDVYICPECFEFVIRNNPPDSEKISQEQNSESSFIPTFELVEEDISDASSQESKYTFSETAPVSSEPNFAEAQNSPIDEDNSSIQNDTNFSNNTFEDAEELIVKSDAPPIIDASDNFTTKESYYLSKYSDAEILY